MDAVLEMRSLRALAMLSANDDETFDEQSFVHAGTFAVVECFWLRLRAAFGSYDTERLDALLNDSRPGVRACALTTLAWYGEQARAPLGESLHRISGDPTAAHRSELIAALHTAAALPEVAADHASAIVELIPAFSWGAHCVQPAETAYQQCLRSIGSAVLPHLGRMLELLFEQQLPAYRSPHFFLSCIEQSHVNAPEMLVRGLIPLLQTESVEIRANVIRMLIRPVRQIRLQHDLKKGQVTMALYELRGEVSIMLFTEQDKQLLRLIGELTNAIDG